MFLNYFILTGSHYVTQAGFRLMFLQSQPPLACFLTAFSFPRVYGFLKTGDSSDRQISWEQSETWTWGQFQSCPPALPWLPSSLDVSCRCPCCPGDRFAVLSLRLILQKKFCHPRGFIAMASVQSLQNLQVLFYWSPPRAACSTNGIFQSQFLFDYSFSGISPRKEIESLKENF